MSKPQLHLVDRTSSSESDRLRKKARKRLRKDIRPAPGTSDLLGRPFDREIYGGDRLYCDWTALMPYHFRGGKLDKQTKKKGRPND